MSKPRSQSVPPALQPRFEAIAAHTDRICREKLNEEWAVLCRELAAALARKRPSPLVRGKPEVWAAGILHALGLVNFLFDRSQSPSLDGPQAIQAAVGVSYASMQAKSKFIRDLFKMMPFDPAWTAPSRMDQNPLIWMLLVNGLPMDVRYAPRDVQEEALHRGLIPYLPPRPDSDAPGKAAPAGARCGLCSATENLTRTECCGQWICDDESEYVMFSFARNSCHRNHSRYTLCSHHFNEGHAGRWQDCSSCREEFETEMYVYYGTNEYNFEKLENPPAYKPTHCANCGRVIRLAEDGYSLSGGKYLCLECSDSPLRPAARRKKGSAGRRRA